MIRSPRNPSWWSYWQNGAWDSARSELQDDWEHRRSLATDSDEAGYDVNRALRWDDVLEPIRYGYGAALFYPNDWLAHRAELRAGWTRTYGDRPFEQVNDYVRFGWDRARRYRAPARRPAPGWGV